MGLGLFVEPVGDDGVHAGVGDHHVAVAEVHKDGVVDDGAVVAEDFGVLAASVCDAGCVFDGGKGDEFFCVFAGDPDIAHVADVEEADVAADCEVFVDDGGVLDGHFEAGEFDEASFEFDLEWVEW